VQLTKSDTPTTLEDLTLADVEFLVDMMKRDNPIDADRFSAEKQEFKHCRFNLARSIQRTLNRHGSTHT